MSEEADAAFAALLPKIKKQEAKYEKISLDDPIARGHVGRKILKLVDEATLSTEYLRHCEQQAAGDLTDSARIQIECMIRIIAARGATHY
jgi:hypothetical protein